MSEKTPKRGIDIEKMEAELSAKGTSWFLGIGINQYQHDFPNLNNAKKDVADILSILKERYEIDRELLLFDDQATRDNIVDQLQILDDKSEDGDKIIIYYAGHGYLDGKERGYWIPHDAEMNRVATFLRNSTIREILSGFAAKHTLIISDSCFSGSLLTRDIGNMQAAFEDLERDRSRWVFSSGRQSEPVADGRAGENSPFAANIIRELDRNSAPFLNAGLLFDKVMKLTRFNYHQLPQSGPLFGSGHEGGQYIFRLKVNESSHWEEAKRSNSIKSYSDYLENFPKGEHAKTALKAITRLEDQKEWESAKDIDKIYAYAKYLRSFPQPIYNKEAKERIETLEKTAEKQTVENEQSLSASSQNPSSAPQRSLPQDPTSNSKAFFKAGFFKQPLYFGLLVLVLGISWTGGFALMGDGLRWFKVADHLLPGAAFLILPTFIFLHLEYKRLKTNDSLLAIAIGAVTLAIVNFLLNQFFEKSDFVGGFAFLVASLAMSFFFSYRIKKAYPDQTVAWVKVAILWGVIWNSSMLISLFFQSEILSLVSGLIAALLFTITFRDHLGFSVAEDSELSS